MKARIALAVLLALALASSGRAGGDSSVSVVSKWDLASVGTIQYAIFGPRVDGTNYITTSGSSTTVTAVTGSPFTPVLVGDELFVRDGPTDGLRRYVTAKASGVSITVDTAVDWSRAGGYFFSYRPLRAGTGDDAGWFGVTGVFDKTISFGLETINATGGIQVQIDCIANGVGTKPVKVYPPISGTGQCGTGLFTVAGITARCDYPISAYTTGRCRFGAKIVTADTGVQDIWAVFSGIER